MTETRPLPTVRIFAPELWGEAERFANFYGETYKFSFRDARAVSGACNHFHKSITLQSLAIKLKPGLEIDRAQLEKNGFTPALNSQELSAVVEAAILELYSSVDCTVKVLRAIYGGQSRSFPESTRRFFKTYERVTGAFPESLKAVLRTADWYERLLFMRDELTHLSTGSCTLDHKTGLVAYMHTGMKVGDKAFVIDNIFTWLEETTTRVNGFLGAIFHALNQTLNSTPVQQVCGIVEGRLLLRYVDPTTTPLTFDSGQCFAHRWFEKPENPTCPFAEGCGAYRRKI